MEGEKYTGIKKQEMMEGEKYTGINKQEMMEGEKEQKNKTKTKQKTERHECMCHRNTAGRRLRNVY